MGDFVTLSMETPNGTVTVSMDYEVWRRLMAAPDHTLKLILARLDFFAQMPHPPRRDYHLYDPEEGLA